MNKMTKLQTTINDFSEIDIYGSDDHQNMVMDVLLDYNEDHVSLHKSYRNALELVRREVLRNYGEATYLKYENEIRHELFGAVVSYVEFCAVDNMKYHFECEYSIREFYEQAMEPFLALDCLYANCVQENVEGAGENDSIH